MGFMAGFGSAFADSFNQDQQVKAQHKEDMFKLQYTDYISRRDKQDQIDMENKKNARLAKQLTSQYNQPPEAWQAVYDYMSAGGSAEGAAKMLQENQAVVDTNSNTTKPGEGATASDAQPADPRDDLTNAASSSVDAQMKASGMKTSQEAGQGQGIFGGLKEALGGNSQARIQRDSQRAQEQVAGAAGVPVEQVQKTLGPGGHVPGEPLDGQAGATIKWQPKGQTFQALDDKANNLGDAQALAIWAEAHGTPEQKLYANQKLEKFKQLKSSEIAQNAFALDPSKAPQRGMIRKKDGTGYEDKFVTADYSNGDPQHPTWRDETGQEVDPKGVAPISAAQEKDMQAVADEGSEDMKPLEQQKLDAKNFIRTSHDYVKLLKDNKGNFDGKAMDITGNISQFGDRYRRAIVNIADLVMPKGNDLDAGTAVGELDAAEKKVRDQLNSGKLVDDVSKNAMKAALIDIQGTKLAYQMAAQANGSTKGISNADFQHFKDVVSGGGNPATAAKALDMSIQQAVKAVSDTEGAVKQGRGKAAYYKGKYPGAPTGFDPGSPFQDDIKADPELSQAMKDISFDASKEDNPGAQMDTAPDAPDWAKKTSKPIIGLTGQEISPEQWKYMSPALQEAIKKKNGL